MEGTLGHKNKQEVCVLCLGSGQNPQPGRKSSQRTLCLCPHFSVRFPPGYLWDIRHILAGCCTEPTSGCPGAQITSLFLSSENWALKSMSVFSPVFGVSAESETCFQHQFLQVIAVLDLSSLLLTYYIGKKRTLRAYTHFSCYLNCNCGQCF